VTAWPTTSTRWGGCTTRSRRSCGAERAVPGGAATRWAPRPASGQRALVGVAGQHPGGAGHLAYRAQHRLEGAPAGAPAGPGGDQVQPDVGAVANVLIADEINRASPRTQSALLEAMDEGQVTVDGVRHPVPHPFLVVRPPAPRRPAAVPAPPRDRRTSRPGSGRSSRTGGRRRSCPHRQSSVRTFTATVRSSPMWTARKRRVHELSAISSRSRYPARAIDAGGLPTARIVPPASRPPRPAPHLDRVDTAAYVRGTFRQEGRIRTTCDGSP
jgi:ATPase family associated with various cellular activities (AAA)